MQRRALSVVCRATVAFALLAMASPAMAQVQFTFYETFPSTAPAPDAPFPGGSVFCTATAAGSATGFNFNFGDLATRQVLCPSNPDRLAVTNQFGARITGNLVAPSAGTYSLFLNTDDGDVLTINGTTVHTDWRAKGGGPGNIGSLSLLAGVNPFILDYFQGPCCGSFVQLTVSGGLTVEPPPSNGVAVVPEPGSLLLLATGLGALGLVASRRRRA